MTKKELRHLYRQKRAALATPQMHSLMAAMLEHAGFLLTTKPAVVFSYRPLALQHEVPADMLVEWWQNNGTSFTITEPRVTGATMEAVVVNEDSDYKTNRFGINEPVGNNIIDPQQIDVVLVPLLAFDERGYRVGYGKGYYDKFFTQCKSNVMKMGLSWFGAEARIDDIEPHDVTLTHCLTPNQLYVF